MKLTPFASVATGDGWAAFFDALGAPEGDYLASATALGREQHRLQKRPPVPTASLRAQKPRADNGMSEVTRRFWKRYYDANPKPLKTKKPTRVDIAPSRDEQAGETLRKLLQGGQS